MKPSGLRHFVNSRPLGPPFPTGTHEAQFAMGCFWGVERLFWKLPGVHVTAVGYAGGHVPDPDCKLVSAGRTGHAEAVRVNYFPDRIRYADLLKVFWEHHDPTQGDRQGNDVGSQYRSLDLHARRCAGRRGGGEPPRLRRGARPRGAQAGDDDAGAAGDHVLVRRGLPPAVPCEESRRVLRHWWVWGPL
jgi:hypothetical protein